MSEALGQPSQPASDEAQEPAASPAEPSISTASLRQDQIQNAVAFLSHPKVRGSAATSKREFLERKGLTAQEIDEAFRRAPETSASVGSPSSAAAGAPSPQAALQATVQHLQPGAPHTGAMVAQPGGYLAMQHAPHSQPLRWSQVALGAGFLAAGAYAVKQLLWPYVWDAYGSWRDRQGGARVRPPPRPKEDGGEVVLAPEAARAMAEAIQAQTAELRSSVEAIREVVKGLEVQRMHEAEGGRSSLTPPGPLPDTVTVAELRQELKTLASTLQETMAAGSPAKGGSGGGGEGVERELGEIRELLEAFLSSPEASRATGAAAALDFGSPASLNSSAAPREPAQQHVGHAEPASVLPTHGSHAAAGTEGVVKEGLPTSGRAGEGQLPRPDSATSLASSAPSQPPHPPSYLEVLEMLEKGVTPPGIRSDINDKPPNPEQPPPQPRLKPRPKPWEKKQGSAVEGAANGRAASPSARSGWASGLVDSFGGPGGVVLRGSSNTSSLASSHGAQPGVTAAGAGAGAGAPANQQAPAHAASGQDADAAAGAEAAGPGNSSPIGGAPTAEAMAVHQSIAARVRTAEEPAMGQAARANGVHAAAHHGEIAGPTREQGGDPEANPAPGAAATASGASYKDALVGGGEEGPAVSSAFDVEATGGAAPTAHHGVFRTPPPRRAASIFEAVAAAEPSSPGVITGRFSPASSIGVNPPFSVMSDETPTNDWGGVRAGGPTQQTMPAAPLMPPQQFPPAPYSTPALFRPSPAPSRELAGSTASSRSGAASPSGPASGGRSQVQDRSDGSGIARPLGSGWRPPPIPVPTLLGSRGEGATSASSHSLGEDFTSAV